MKKHKRKRIFLDDPIDGSTTAAKREEATKQRNSKGRFVQGNQVSRGKRLKQWNLSTALRAAITPIHFEQLAAVLLKKALAGDLSAIGMIYDRAVGRPRLADVPPLGVPELPEITDAESARTAVSKLASLASRGELSTDEASRLSRLIRDTARILDPKHFLGDFEDEETIENEPDPAFLDVSFLVWLPCLLFHFLDWV